MSFVFYVLAIELGSLIKHLATALTNFFFQWEVACEHGLWTLALSWKYVEIYNIRILRVKYWVHTAVVALCGQCTVLKVSGRRVRSIEQAERCGSVEDE